MSFFLRLRMKNHIRPAMIARPTAPPTAPPAIAPVLDEEDPEELPDSLLENTPVPLAVVMMVTVSPPPADDPVDAVFVVTAPGTPALSADDTLVVGLGEGVPEDDVLGIDEVADVVEMTRGGARLVEGEVVEGVMVVVISLVAATDVVTTDVVTTDAVTTDVVTMTTGAVVVSGVVVGASYVTARYWVKPLNS